MKRNNDDLTFFSHGLLFANQGKLLRKCNVPLIVNFLANRNLFLIKMSVKFARVTRALIQSNFNGHVMFIITESNYTEFTLKFAHALTALKLCCIFEVQSNLS